MSDWKLKRFWTVAEVAATEDGYAVHLDGRGLRTPAKALLALPTRPLAEAIASEWAAQPHDKPIDPTTMPLTRTANSALDKVAPQRADVADMLAEYGGCDLLCYRAEAPAALVARQAAAWDPLLDWCASALGAPLICGQGVSYIEQPEPSLRILAGQVHGLDPWQLAGFHDLVALSGSLVLALAATQKVAPAPDLWVHSRVDELWQQQHWGEDEIATAAAEVKRQGFLDAFRFFSLCRSA